MHHSASMLTRCLNNMVAILQTTFSKTFFRNRVFSFWFTVHQSLVQVPIFQYGYNDEFVKDCRQAITPRYDDTVHWCMYASPGSDNLTESLPDLMVVILLTTSNGSWCMGIKGEMSGTVCVTFTWYMYIYELFIAFVCFVVCSLL